MNAEKFHYSSMQVTSISAESLTFNVPYPGGGGATTTIDRGLDGGSFSYRDLPSIEVGLMLVHGKPALVLQPGSAS